MISDKQMWDDVKIESFKSRSRLVIQPKGKNFACMTVDSPTPRPNWWWRMWYWLLLGWKWEKVEENK
jgi:hypothetical protein